MHHARKSDLDLPGTITVLRSQISLAMYGVVHGEAPNATAVWVMPKVCFIPRFYETSTFPTTKTPSPPHLPLSPLQGCCGLVWSLTMAVGSRKAH